MALMQTRPTAMQSGSGLTFATNNAMDLFSEGKSSDFAVMRDTFGMLLGKPKNDLCGQATTVDAFMCHMNVFDAYKKREWPIFGDFVTAQILNSRNSFLVALSPILETPEINFTVERTIISSMPFTEIAPCGIPEEPSGSYTYSWQQTVRQYEQGCTINRDLVLDPNFGAQTWLATLSYFVANARLTIDMGIITTLVQTGYENMARSLTEGSPIDPDKLWFEINDSFLLAAVDPQEFMNYVRNKEAMIPDMDTLIIPAGKSSYLRDVQGDSMTMLVQKLSTDPVTSGVMVDFAEGPDSYKSIKLANRVLHIIEFQPFFLGDKEPMRINPLMTRLVIGQFYPPNPFLTPQNCADKRFLCGEVTDTNIFQQTKKIGLQQAVTLKTRLENAIYWDKKSGKVSETAKAFAKQQTMKRRQRGQEPWDWNPNNPEADRSADVNNESTSLSEPNMREIGCKVDLRDMKSWREEFVGLLYNPETREFMIPPRVGDFHMRSIPNDYVKMATELLELKMKEVTGRSVEEGFVQVRKLGKALKNAPVTDDFLYSLLDKNLGRMINFRNGEWGFETVRTPLVRDEKHTTKNANDRCKYPDAEIVEEAKGNRFGGWDLPDKPTTLKQDYIPFFASGAGIRTLAQEALKEGNSLYFNLGKEAMEAELFADTLVKFMKEFVGKSDLTNPRLLPPWFHKTSAIAKVLDSIIGTAGPVHVGIPENINFQDDSLGEGEVVPSAGGPTRRGEIAGNASFLRTTVVETDLAIRNAIRDKAPREIINSATRALACLSETAYTKMRTVDDLIKRVVNGVVVEGVAVRRPADDIFKAEMITVLHQVYDILIKMCAGSTSKGETTQAIIFNSTIAEAFIDLLNTYEPLLAPLDDDARDKFRTSRILKEMRSFIGNFITSTGATNNNGIKKFLNAEKAKREKANGIECIEYGEGFIEALKEYEKPVGPSQRVKFTRNDTGAFTASRTPATFRGNYQQIRNEEGRMMDTRPVKYIRTPLTSSAALREYLRDKDIAWVVPSDSNNFYATPEDPSIVTSNSAVCTNPHHNKLELCSLSRKLVLQSRFATKKGASSSTASRDSDLFGSLRSTKTDAKATQARKPLNAGQFLNMGQYRGEDDCYEDSDPSYEAVGRRAQTSARHPYITPSGDVDLNDAMRTEYPGPWRERLKYIHNEINTVAGKWFARAILESPNKLEVFTKLSTIGAVLLDVMIVRPFIELRTSAAIAMKAGRDTMITTIGHSHVQVTKESRGCWHINVGFFMGLIKINSDNVVLIPNAFPESLVGGKDINFMTDMQNLSLPNPAKESAIAVLIGGGEREFDGPIHMTNGPTAYRPNVDYAYHLRKHSAGRWVEFILGPNTANNIDMQNMNRETYATCLKASNILGQGPATYIDPRNGDPKDVEGNGPMGQFIMNMPGVQSVYEGRAQRFPDRLQMYSYTKK